MEEKQMEKARAYYIYKKLSDLQEAVEKRLPIAGILRKMSDGQPQMYAVYKIPGKRFGWCTVSFDDQQGTRVCGLWYAPMLVEEANAPPSSTKEITALAKLATVAIPLRYPFGDNHQDAHKYCVISSRWSERNEKGKYILPSLAFEVYKEDTPRTSTTTAAPAEPTDS